MGDDFHENVLKYHKDSYENKHTQCCITSLNKVHSALLNQNIPSILVYPTHGVINECLDKLYLKYTAEINTYSQIAILTININTPEKYCIAGENEYQSILDRMKISEQIYLFATKIRASVIETSINSYMLFATKNILELETSNYSKFELVNTVTKMAFCSISIGVGYGQTVSEAKYNANLALMMADRKSVV